MDSCLLIDNIDVDRCQEEEVEVFFQIGQMPDVRDRVMDLFNHPDCHYYGKCFFKYDGFSLKMKVKDIPDLLKDLLNKGLRVYSVYQPYNP